MITLNCYLRINFINNNHSFSGEKVHFKNQNKNDNKFAPM